MMTAMGAVLGVLAGRVQGQRPGSLRQIRHPFPDADGEPRSRKISDEEAPFHHFVQEA